MSIMKLGEGDICVTQGYPYGQFFVKSVVSKTIPRSY